jgi:hypothetical protein
MDGVVPIFVMLCELAVCAYYDVACLVHAVLFLLYIF